MECAGNRPIPLWCVPAGPELTGRHNSAPLPAVWLADRCRRPRGVVVLSVFQRDAR